MAKSEVGRGADTRYAPERPSLSATLSPVAEPAGCSVRPVAGNAGFAPNRSRPSLDATRYAEVPFRVCALGGAILRRADILVRSNACEHAVRGARGNLGLSPRCGQECPRAVFVASLRSLRLIQFFRVPCGRLFRIESENQNATIGENSASFGRRMHGELAKKWLGKLTRLNPATGRGQCRGKAPHKPLLLLSLADLAEAGELTGRTFTRTAGLVLRFKSYGALVAERWPTRLDLRMPFFHLRNQGFWQAFTLEMTPAQSPESCFVCEMHEEFFDLLGNADFRLKARLLLVTRYFEPRERVALLESLGLGEVGKAESGKRKGAPHPAYGHLLPGAEKGYTPDAAERAGAKLNEEAEDAARKQGRSARFAVQVVSRYKFTCALTGLCCLTTDGAAIVDAAHIEPFWETQNDDIGNGLALCKNAHWMFDEGLWSVRTDGRVVLAPHRFTENGPEGLRLQPYAGRLLQFAAGVSLRPKVEYFVRHRTFHGFST